jgi:hypothetical protein
MAGQTQGTNANDLEAGIGRGLEFLRRSQLPSGELKDYVSPDLNLQYACVFDRSPFPAALIACWLGFDDKAGMDVLSKAPRFLLNLRARYR